MPESQRAETTLLMLQQTYDRNERLANYIQITNTGVFGFLGLIAIGIFKDGVFFYSIQVLAFLFVIIFSMGAWRWIIHQYQDSIIDGYIKIINCESEDAIDIGEKTTFKHAFTEKNRLSSDIKDTDLITFLRTRYEDTNHTKLDYIALIFGSISFGLILSFLCICQCVRK